jgi:hypothetical protein
MAIMVSKINRNLVGEVINASIIKNKIRAG